MSGVLGVIAGQSVERITAVIKSAGTGGTGAGAPSLFGNTVYTDATITPSSVRGKPFVGFDSLSTTCDFRVEISGDQGQSAFRLILVRDGAGSIRSFLASAASYSVPSGNSVWVWGTGSNQVWAASDDSETKVIEICF